MVPVPEGFLRTVFFLCVEKEDEDGERRRQPHATGFFVRVPLLGDRQAGADYMVTARHCINEARPYDNVYIRFNKKDGSFIELPTMVDDWTSHDSADVAALLAPRRVLPGGVTPRDLDTASLKLADFVGGGPEYEYVGEPPEVGPVKIQPRVGSEIYLLGLFSEHYGGERNLPVARFGHISRMPNPVQLESHGVRFEVVAYLAEFHSWGGHSGSPVFFLHPMMLETQVLDEGGRVRRTTLDLAHVTGFLGLLSAHYGIPEKVEATGDMLGSMQVQLNSGIAVITPAHAVGELLMREDLVEQREALAKDVER